MSLAPKVFISYSAPDEYRAMELRARFEAEGFPVWIAPAALKGGDRLSRIHDELEAADFVVVVLTHQSTNSPWVRHEMNTALALGLERGKPVVMGVFLEPAPRPTALADVLTTQAHGDQYERGLEELIAALRGESPGEKSLLARFRDFLAALEPVPDDLARTIDLQFTINASDFDKASESSRASLARGQRMLDEELRRAGCSEAIRQRVLDAFDTGSPPPTVGRQALQQTLSWVREADDLTIRFAAALWQLRGMAGITLNWVFGFLRRDQAAFHNKAYNQASGEYEWQARNLVENAFALGLLTRSTERPRGRYEKLDAEANPSYNRGPNVFTIGRLAHHFLQVDAPPVGPTSGSETESTDRVVPNPDSPLDDSLW